MPIDGAWGLRMFEKNPYAAEPAPRVRFQSLWEACRAREVEDARRRDAALRADRQKEAAENRHESTALALQKGSPKPAVRLPRLSL